MTDLVLDPQTVRDYLSGRLSEVASREFEGRLLREPALARSLEEMARFREGLEVLRERGELNALLEERPKPWLRWALPLASAAAVVVAVLIVALPRSSLMSASIDGLRLPGSAIPAVVAQYSLAAVRGTTGPELDLPTAGVVQFRILASGPSGMAYRVVLRRHAPDGNPGVVASAAGVPLDASGFVTVYADAARLSPGDYSVTATPEANAEQPGTAIRFRLRAASSPPAG